jgi:hypothetical protein
LLLDIDVVRDVEDRRCSLSMPSTVLLIRIVKALYSVGYISARIPVDRRRIGPQTALQARRRPDRGSPHLPRRHGRRSRRGNGSLGGLIFALIRMGSSAFGGLRLSAARQVMDGQG